LISAWCPQVAAIAATISDGFSDQLLPVLYKRCGLSNRRALQIDLRTLGSPIERYGRAGAGLRAERHVTLHAANRLCEDIDSMPL
jgi:hypothetical protein